MPQHPPAGPRPSPPAPDHRDWALELKQYAAARLPAYLVPDVIAVLDELPTTPNGKIDRKALAAAPVTAVPTGPAPRTEDERALCALFTEVLRIPAAGLDTDFFEAGGDSLLAMRLAWSVRLRLGRELSVRDVYDFPTVAALTPRLVLSGDPVPALAPRSSGGPDPLSPAQRRLWFLNRLEDGAATYNIPVPLRLRGPLDEEALWAALAALVTRHESLRTLFPETAGEPRQVVLEPAEAHPRPDHVRLTPEELPAHQEEFERRGFDLRTDPPLRARLVSLGPEEHVLLLVVHHIACDGRSMTPLARDLSEAYAAHRKSGTAPLPPLPVQYRDFTHWQHELLGDPDTPGSPLARQLDFWTEALRDLPAQLDLPTDRPRPARAGHRGDTVHFRLGAPLTRALEGFAAARGASPFMVVQAALAATLTRLGAGHDLPVGTPVAGRADADLDELVGFFVNTLVLRTDTSGDPGFGELVDRVKEFTFRAFAHQDLPFDLLVEALNPPRSPARHPLFQVMLVFEDSDPGPPALTGLDVTRERPRLDAARFDLVFDLTPPPPGGTGETLGHVEYATALFDRATVERIVGHLLATLEQGLSEPDLPLSRHETRSPAELDFFDSFNDTDHPVPDTTLPALFEAQVARTPDRTAVTDDTGALTFAELDARANRLARHLLRLGAGPERTVALAMPRSAELVVALWAVVKTGAAYLPVDLSHPPARVHAMLEDALPLLVLTTAKAADGLPAAVAPLAVDDPDLRAHVDALDPSAPTDADRPVPLRPGHPLYLIYTSGSTGRPKGVVMPAAPIVNLLAWHASKMPAAPDSVTAQFAALSFDPAAQEILSAGTTGKTLAVPAEEVRRSPGDLAHWLAANRVTELFAPTALIEQLCREALGQGLDLPDLRHVAQGGEALVLTDAVRSFFDAVPERRLHNYYGPTETHAATGHTVARPVTDQPARVPLGEPIWNTRILLLDEHLRPVPLGVTGEVFVAGAAVARGYAGRPVETAERFLPDPDPASPPGSRMYRTGDLARLRSDGRLDYLGRNDFQVKIRGFRIEPGEVEEALRAAPGVAEAVVAADPGHHTGVRLCGYVVPLPGTTVEPARVREHLAGTLPGYMVPAVITVLERMPVGPHGKVDLRALPTPGPAPAGTGRAPAPGREHELAVVFAAVLGLPEVGATDEFFEIGGHSLLVTRLIDEIRAALGMELPVRAFFDEPTVEGVARRLVPLARSRPRLTRRTGRPARS
ncbi:amino acid adenylation domain-containing protein [Streptomyces sp. NPDC097619]|uniref:non-ribosomal peptide synthetase n=1 Tax=Streptomyces sp. NPDC097619 TaxID=3157228 RepID=UPI003326BB82